MDSIKKVTLIGSGTSSAFFAPRLYNWLEEGDFKILTDLPGKKSKESVVDITVNGINYVFPTISPDYAEDTSDLIIITSDNLLLEGAIKSIKNQVGPETIILAVCNGVEAEEKVAKAYGEEHVLYSFMHVTITKKSSIFEFNPSKSWIHFGEKLNHTYSDRVKLVKQLFDLCHIPYQISENMVNSMWYKFVYNTADNMVCSLLNCPLGIYRMSEDAMAIRNAVIDECIEVARAEGIPVEPLISRHGDFIDKFKYDRKPKVLRDLSKKKSSEIDAYSGLIIRLGKKYGVPTPINELIYRTLKIQEEKNSGKL